MPIKVEPFKNPFVVSTSKTGAKVKVIIHNGKIYEQVVRKK